jgi:hypothetical protein
MKCLPECGYSHLPNNAVQLKAHVEACFINGACKELTDVPLVVWRDGEFFVVRSTDKKEQLYDIGIVMPKEEVKEVVDVVLDYEDEKSSMSSGIEDEGDQALN